MINWDAPEGEWGGHITEDTHGSWVGAESSEADR